MIRTAAAFACAALLSAAATPAAALATFSAWSAATFSVEFDPTDILTEGEVFLTDESVFELGTGVVDVFAPDQAVSDSGVSTAGEIGGSAAAPDGVAEASLLTDGFLSFLNVGTAPVTLFHGWTLSGSAATSLDDPATEFAFAVAGAAIVVELFDPESGGTVLFEQEGFALSDTGFGSDFFDDFGSGEIVLEPGFVLEVSLIADQEGGADAFSPIPLPAAAPLTLLGLGALGAVRRRRRASRPAAGGLARIGA